MDWILNFSIMIRKIAITFLLMTFQTLYVKAQTIGADSRGKSVFTHVSPANLRLETSQEEPLVISYFQTTDSIESVLVPSRTKIVEKFTGINYRLSLRNADKFTSLSQLKKLNPGVGFRLGYQITVPKFDDIDKMPKKYWSTYTCGINALVDMDNINLYDPKLGFASKKYPISYGIEGNLSLFFRSYKFINQLRIRHSLSFNFSVLRTWNDDLKSYQELSRTTIDSNVIVLKDFAGKYGSLQNDINRFRFSVSAPIYLWHLNLIPFGAVYLNTFSTPRYHLGVFANILKEKLTVSNFKIPSSLGIGVDRVMQTSSASTTEIYIRGSLNF